MYLTASGRDRARHREGVPAPPPLLAPRVFAHCLCRGPRPPSSLRRKTLKHQHICRGMVSVVDHVEIYIAVCTYFVSNAIE